MRKYQERVIKEREDLRTKIRKLSEFIGGDRYNKTPAPEQNRMIRQREIMKEYDKVLTERIEAFPP